MANPPFSVKNAYDFNNLKNNYKLEQITTVLIAEIYLYHKCKKVPRTAHAQPTHIPEQKRFTQ